MPRTASAQLLNSNCGLVWWGLPGGDVAGVDCTDGSGVDCNDVFGVDRTDGNDGLIKMGLGGYVYIYSTRLYRW